MSININQPEKCKELIIETKRSLTNTLNNLNKGDNDTARVYLEETKQKFSDLIKIGCNGYVGSPHIIFLVLASKVVNIPFDMVQGIINPKGYHDLDGNFIPTIIKRLGLINKIYPITQFQGLRDWLRERFEEIGRLYNKDPLDMLHLVLTGEPSK